MPHVFSVRRNLEILHVGFQDLDLNSREAEHGAVVVDELPDERGGAPQALRLFFDGGGLLGSEAEGLSEVVVSCGFWAFGSRSFLIRCCSSTKGDSSKSQERFQKSSRPRAGPERFSGRS